MMSTQSVLFINPGNHELRFCEISEIAFPLLQRRTKCLKAPQAKWCLNLLQGCGKTGKRRYTNTVYFHQNIFWLEGGQFAGRQFYREVIHRRAIFQKAVWLGTIQWEAIFQGAILLVPVHLSFFPENYIFRINDKTVIVCCS